MREGASQASGIDLPDLNIWLALVAECHPHHQQAIAYWDHLAAPDVRFSTVTALGLVRLLCQPKVMGVAVKRPAEASTLLQSLCAQPGVTISSTEHQSWEVFHRLLLDSDLPPRLCTDAHLAAVAISQGWRLVTFDRDFERFNLLQLLIP